MDKAHTSALTQQLEKPRILEVALFAIGLLLPLVSVSGSHGTETFLVRLAIADLISAMAIIWFVPLNLRLFRLHPSHIFYAITLCIAGIIGVSSADPSSEKIIDIVVEWAALLMAFQYLIIGYNIGRDTSLVRILMLGIACGIFWESIIVLHDFIFAGSQWFPDPLLGRVRGTFRASGQLGAYGFSAAGVMLCLGWSSFENKNLRRLMILAGVLAVFFTVAASRRSAMITIAIWLAMFLILGIRHADDKTYILTWLFVLILAAVAIVIYPTTLRDSFTVQRLDEAITGVQQSDSFILEQLHAVINGFSKWFPFGLGIERGYLLDKVNELEIHNGNLSLIVQTGVLGLLSFYWAATQPFFRSWKATDGPPARIVKTLVFSFLIAALGAMMVHNRLFRDRTFMLYLGLASTIFIGNTTASSKHAAKKQTLEAVTGNPEPSQ